MIVKVWEVSNYNLWPISPCIPLLFWVTSYKIIYLYMKTIWRLVILFFLLSSCDHNGEVTIREVFHSDFSSKLVAVSFASPSTGVLLTEDKDKLSFWRTEDAGKTWYDIFDWYGMKFWNPEKQTGLFCLGDVLIGMAVPNGGVPLGFLFDLETCSLTNWKAPEEMHCLSWCDEEKVYGYYNQEGCRYEVTVNDKGGMTTRQINDNIVWTQIESSGRATFGIRLGTDSLFYHKDDISLTLEIPSPERIAAIDDNTVVVSSCRDDKLTLYYGSVAASSLKECYSFKGYSFVSHLLANESCIVSEVSNPAGVWGGSSDYFYSLDNGKTWKKYEQGVQSGCCCLVETTLYYSNAVTNNLYKVSFEKCGNSIQKCNKL